MTEFQKLREWMVREQILARGVKDPLVIKAMRTVPRERFIPPHLWQYAYDDGPLPIGEGQTISQPFIVAYMVEALMLTGEEKVLEVGAGSGYAAAVLAEIVGDVFAIERIGGLAEIARSNLVAAGYDSVNVRHADGTRGWEEEAPFDAILVSAGAQNVPEALKHQLKIGGRLVVPAARRGGGQELVRITRTGEESYQSEDLTEVQFVPLIGSEELK